MNKVLENIRSMRLLKGWSQEMMAEKLEMSPNGYANIERGETDIQMSRLEQIAQILEVELSDLFTFDKGVIFKVFIHKIDMTNHNQQIINSNSPCTTTTLNSEHELEKARLIIEQKDKEIAYLKEIIELAKK
jgi:transcriptional regulator with XRE-family HTH domain